MRVPLVIAIAPDSFGGALDAVGVARAIAVGWRGIRPHDEIVQIPMADGGGGTLDAVATASGNGQCADRPRPSVPSVAR